MVQLQKHEFLGIILISLIIVIGIGVFSYLTGFNLIHMLTTSGLKLDLITATCQANGYTICTKDPITGVLIKGNCFSGYIDTGSTCVLPTRTNPPQTTVTKASACPYGTTFNGQICAYSQQPSYGEIATSDPNAPACKFLSWLPLSLSPCKPNAPSLSNMCIGTGDIVDVYGTCCHTANGYKLNSNSICVKYNPTTGTTSNTVTNQPLQRQCSDGSVIDYNAVCPSTTTSSSTQTIDSGNTSIQTFNDQIAQLQSQLKLANQTGDIQTTQSTQQQILLLQQKVQSLQSQLVTQNQNSQSTSSGFDFTGVINLVKTNPWIVVIAMFIIIFLILIIVVAKKNTTPN